MGDDNNINGEIKNIEDKINSNNIILLKFDDEDSKYDIFLRSINYKIINITDKEIIEFYGIDVLPSIFIYKNKNLLNVIEGFHTKSVFLKKINDALNNS